MGIGNQYMNTIRVQVHNELQGKNLDPLGHNIKHWALELKHDIPLAYNQETCLAPL